MASTDEKNTEMTKRQVANIQGIMLMLVTKLFVIAGAFTLYAGKPDCCERQSLFKIERTRDADEVYYDVNLCADGSLYIENPVNVYWVRHTGDGRHDPLTWMQRRYAYGINILEREKDRVVFQFVSYNKMTFVVRRDPEGVFKVYMANSNETQVRIIRVFFEPGTSLIPSIEKVELHTLNSQSGRMTIQTVNP